MKIIEINKYKKKIKITKHQNHFEIKGPLGTLNHDYSYLNNKSSSNLFIKKSYETFFINKIKSLFRSVSVGWYKELIFKGIGYKCFKIDDKIALDIGYSNLILYKPTNNIKVKNLKGKIAFFSIDQEYLNNVTNSLKNYSIPDKYKGKGIWVKDQVVKLKKKAKT